MAKICVVKSYPSGRKLKIKNVDSAPSQSYFPPTFCLICLDTACKLYPLGKYLAKAYSNITGIKKSSVIVPNVCTECAQRLINCNKFRDKMLSAHYILAQLYEKYKTLTLEKIKTINRESYQLTSNLVKQIFEPDHCNLYLNENLEQEENIQDEDENQDYDLDEPKHCNLYWNGNLEQEENLQGEDDSQDFDVDDETECIADLDGLFNDVQVINSDMLNDDVTSNVTSIHIEDAACIISDSDTEDAISDCLEDDHVAETLNHDGQNADDDKINNLDQVTNFVQENVDNTTPKPLDTTKRQDIKGRRSSKTYNMQVDKSNESTESNNSDVESLDNNDQDINKFNHHVELLNDYDSYVKFVNENIRKEEDTNFNMIGEADNRLTKMNKAFNSKNIVSLSNLILIRTKPNSFYVNGHANLNRDIELNNENFGENNVVLVTRNTKLAEHKLQHQTNIRCNFSGPNNKSYLKNALKDMTARVKSKKFI